MLTVRIDPGCMDRNWMGFRVVGFQSTWTVNSGFRWWGFLGIRHSMANHPIGWFWGPHSCIGHNHSRPRVHEQFRHWILHRLFSRFRDMEESQRSRWQRHNSNSPLTNNIYQNRNVSGLSWKHRRYSYKEDIFHIRIHCQGSETSSSRLERHHCGQMGNYRLSRSVDMRPMRHLKFILLYFGYTVC